MKMFRNLILAGLALALCATLSIHQAEAKSLVLCRPDPAGTAAGPVRVTNPGTSGGSYVLNAQGCAVINTANSDAAYFLSQGYTQGPNLFSLVQTGITASTTSTTSTITLPPGAMIVGIVINETAGNAITGGVNIGNATSATAYASAVTVGASALVAVADSALTRVYPATATAGAFTGAKVLIACASACNSGSLDVTIFYAFF